MNIINKLCSYIERRSGNKNISLWRTIYINFRTLPFKQAIRLPLRLYGKIRLAALDGKITLVDPTHIFKIGRNYTGYRNTPDGRICLITGANLILHPGVLILQGVNILVNKNATLELKPFCTIGDNTDVICCKSIIIGKNTDLTWGGQLMDFNSHFIQNKDGSIPQIFKPVQIGDYCWIGNRSTIMPGTILPDRVIVASNSLLNKDYSKIVKSGSLMAGQPAKVVKENVYRIYDKEFETKLMNHYRGSNEPHNI